MTRKKATSLSGMAGFLPLGPVILLGPVMLLGLVISSGGCSDQGRPIAKETTPPREDAVDEEHLEDRGRDVVELSGEKAAAAGIETVAVSFSSLPSRLVTTGQVDFSQDRLAHVSPRIPGRVDEVHARLGQRVRQGEPLAVLDSIVLGRAKADYLQASARELLTRENFERETALFADRISSEREMLAARAAHIEAHAELRNADETLHLYGLGEEEVAALAYGNPGRSLYPIRAPFSGKVVEKHVTVGELATPERILFVLADLSEVWVWFDIYERDLASVHLEDLVDVRVDAFPEQVFHGRLSYLSDSVDLDTRRLRARIDVENLDERLRPGMFAQVEISDPHREGGVGVEPPILVVPENTIQRDGDSIFAFVALGEGRYLRREVRSGRRVGGLVEILEGLEAGEVVVSEGAFFLKSELATDELGEGHGH